MAIWIDTGHPGFPENGQASSVGASSSDGSVLISSNLEPESIEGYIWVSIDYGGTWTKITGPGVHNWGGFAMSSTGEKQIGVAYQGKIWTSSNYGITWTEQTLSGTKNWIGVCCSSDGSIIYAIEADGLCYKSDDSGATWAATDSAASSCSSIACSANGSVVLAGCAGLVDNVYLSTNGGANWAVTLNGDDILAVAMDDAGDNMVAVEGTGDVFVSNDGGDNWTNVTNDPQGNSTNAFVSSDGSVMFVNRLGGTYFSYDSGANWGLDISGSPSFTSANKTDGGFLLGFNVNWFTYEGTLPSETGFTITSITPDHGPTVGGTPVTITGTGFLYGATAAIDGNDLTDVVVVDETTITGVTPAGTVGAKDVTVTNQPE